MKHLSDDTILRIARQSGIQFDTYGSPIVDNKQILIEFVKNITTQYIREQCIQNGNIQ